MSKGISAKISRVISGSSDILQERFVQSLSASLEALRNQERIVVGLSGWNSLKVFYGALKHDFGNLEKDLREKIYFCFLDERVVDFEDTHSNYKLVRGILLDELVGKWLLGVDHILLPDFSLGDYELEYFRKVQRIDIGLVGVGEDGHICSLFPNHQLLENTDYSYLRIEDSPKPPANRITVSRSMLQSIDTAFIFFMGESKLSALQGFLDESADYRDCPARLVLECENVVLLSDIIY